MPLYAATVDGLPAWRAGRTGRPVTYGHATGRTAHDAAREAHLWALRRSARRLAAFERQHGSRSRLARRDAVARSLGRYSGRVSAFSEAITRSHEAMLASQIQLAHDVLLRVAGPEIAALEAQSRRQDSAELFTLLQAIRVIREVMAGGAERTREGFVFLGQEMDEDVTDGVDTELSRLFTIPLATAAGASGLIEEWVSDNVALITSLTDQSLGEVEDMVTQAATGGVPTRRLRDEIQQRFNVGRSRANLIARDQTAKLAGRIAQARHEDYGVHRYEWSTSGDGRVRQSHANLDGRIFTYAEGAPGESGRINPGEEFQCRCVGLAVLPDEDEETLRRLAIARQEQELELLQASPVIQGEIENYSGFSDWNAARIAALRAGTRSAVGL